MKALVKYAKGPGNTRLEEIAKPVPGANEVRIKVEYAGICGTDLHIYNDRGLQYNPPVVMGHELSGTVDCVGENVSDELIGQRVASETYYYTCGECYYCRNGKYNLCPDRKSIGSFVNGAFAEFVVVPGKNLHFIPDHVKFEEAVLTEPLACCCQAVYENTNLLPDDHVLITGPGTVGLLCLQLVKLAGCKCIIVGTQKDKERLEIARSLGADQILFFDDPEIEKKILHYSNNLGPDFAFDCSGFEGAINLCIDSIKKGGTYVQVGLSEKKILFDITKFSLKEIRAFGTNAQKWIWWEKALNLLSDGLVDTKVLVETEDLENWEETFRKSIEGSGIKHLLKP